MQEVLEVNIGGALSVSQLSVLIKQCVDLSFSHVSVQGEVSGLKIHSSGHAYYALKDKDNVIDAVVWRGNKYMHCLSDGAEVLCFGKIVCYTQKSKYQLIVDRIEQIGLGALLIELEALKKRLELEGFFQRKRALPSLPRRIGIVTSESGAVVQDILSRLKERVPCDIYIAPALMQGVGCPESVIDALYLLQEHNVDVIIVARGGGSIEDLWGFNNEALARVVFNSTIPVISAIGHETDYTLIDYVSDFRAPTPTAAAEKVLPTTIYMYEVVTNLLLGMERIIMSRIERMMISLLAPKHPMAIIETYIQRLDDIGEAMHMHLEKFLMKLDNGMHRITLREYNIQAIKMSLSSINIAKLIQMHISERQKNLNNTYIHIKNNSLQSIMHRGFAYAERNKSVVRSIKQIKLEEEIDIHFSDGVCIAQIKKIC